MEMMKKKIIDKIESEMEKYEELEKLYRNRGIDNSKSSFQKCIDIIRELWRD